MSLPNLNHEATITYRPMWGLGKKRTVTVALPQSDQWTEEEAQKAAARFLETHH